LELNTVAVQKSLVASQETLDFGEIAVGFR